MATAGTPPPLSRPEALAVSLCVTLVAIIVIAYLWGRVGQIAPATMLAAALAAATASALWLGGAARAHADRDGSRAAIVAFAVTTAVLLYFAWPTLLPPGHGPDLTHHLMLIDFVERNWQLPGANMADALVEMAHYTPGVHLLAALAGAWSGTDGFRAVYPVIAITVALKSVLVALIAVRTLPPGRARVPLTLLAVGLCAVPTRYFVGSFAIDSFFAQAASELFAVGMWWAVTAWDARPTKTAAMLFAVAGIGAFLTWPMWIGPPIVTFIVIAVTHEAVPLGPRVAAVALGCVPIALIAAVHAAGRIGWLAIAGTTGIVLTPSLDVLGWPFLLAALVGVALAPWHRQHRVTFILALSIAAQAATLYAVAQLRGAAIPYMAFKMMYLMVYPLGVLAAGAIGQIIARPKALAARSGVLSVALLAVITVSLTFRISRTPRPARVVSADMYEAGRWARGHVEAACVDYLVPNHETMHWLHLAVLGNPRSTRRAADPATFDPQTAVVRWIEPIGLPYAIAHLPTLPNDVLENVDVLERFGDAAVVSRRGPSSCDDAQRLAVDASRTP